MCSHFTAFPKSFYAPLLVDIPHLLTYCRVSVVLLPLLLLLPLLGLLLAPHLAHTQLYVRIVSR